MSFWIALGCLTIVPCGPRGELPESACGRSFQWFPLVGLLIGGVLVGVHVGVSRVAPSFVAAACVLATWVVMTGALHLDGFADVCDGLSGGRTPQERLQIMKDPHVGAMAVIAVCVLLLVKVALISGLPHRFMVPALLLSPCLGRCAMVWLGTTLPYARTEGGVAAAFVQSAGPWPLWTASVVALVATGLLLVRMGPVVLLVSLLATIIVRRVFRRTLGGVTGDALGAAGELLETLTLLAIVVMGR